MPAENGLVSVVRNIEFIKVSAARRMRNLQRDFGFCSNSGLDVVESTFTS